MRDANLNKCPRDLTVKRDGDKWPSQTNRGLESGNGIPHQKVFRCFETNLRRAQLK